MRARRRRSLVLTCTGTALAGGLVCVAAMVVLARAQPGFLRYDARTPTP